MGVSLSLLIFQSCGKNPEISTKTTSASTSRSKNASSLLNFALTKTVIARFLSKSLTWDEGLYLQGVAKLVPSPQTKSRWQVRICFLASSHLLRFCPLESGLPNRLGVTDKTICQGSEGIVREACFGKNVMEEVSPATWRTTPQLKESCPKITPYFPTYADERPNLLSRIEFGSYTVESRFAQIMLFTCGSRRQCTPVVPQYEVLGVDV